VEAVEAVRVEEVVELLSVEAEALVGEASREETVVVAVENTVEEAIEEALVTEVVPTIFLIVTLHAGVTEVEAEGGQIPEVVVAVAADVEATQESTSKI
jgi:hypothetical protein